MFSKKNKKNNDPTKTLPSTTAQTPVTLDNLKRVLANIDEAEIIERQTNNGQQVMLLYIRSLVNLERLNEAIVEPLNTSSHLTIHEYMISSKVSRMITLEEAETHLLRGNVILYGMDHEEFWAVPLQNTLSRSIQQSGTETIIYGAKDSFSEVLEQNITMIRRRIPLMNLKTESFTIGSISKTEVVILYIEGITNPDYVSIARKKIASIDFDQFLDSSQVAAFMEDHKHSVFPQFQETDRPDSCAFSLGIGKLVILVGNTSYALIAPITFFHLFQSPEDYFLRWIISSFLRCIRYLSFIISVTLIPFYVAVTTHHYQMIPLQILFVLLESRSKLPFSPFWEAFIMLITLEIIKEASLRMPTKSGQTLGVIGGIVIGQATVAAGFASNVLIVLVGISAIASFLVPNYEVTKSNSLLQFILLLLAAYLGLFGILLGAIGILAHLNGLSSLKQPYFAPVAPFYLKEWKDLFIRAPLPWMKTRPEYLHPVQKWRMSRRR